MRLLGTLLHRSDLKFSPNNRQHFRLQIETTFNYLPTSTAINPKGNLLINKFANLEHLKYLDLYKCKWVSLIDLEIAIKLSNKQFNNK